MNACTTDLTGYCQCHHSQMGWLSNITALESERDRLTEHRYRLTKEVQERNEEIDRLKDFLHEQVILAEQNGVDRDRLKTELIAFLKLYGKQ